MRFPMKDGNVIGKDASALWEVRMLFDTLPNEYSTLIEKNQNSHGIYLIDTPNWTSDY